jgi:hypothetical protein
MSRLNKFFVSILLSVFVFVQVTVYFAPQVSAQGPWYNQEYDSWYAKVYSDAPDNELFGERYTAAQVQWVVYGLMALIFNSIQGEFFECLADKRWIDCGKIIGNLFTSYDNAPQVGALAIMTSNPISSVAYFRDIGQRLKIVPEAQAQTTGFGFTAGGAVLQLWKASRNLSYMLLVIVMVVMAFMIMFRVKLSPQTVITVQSALPKVIVALILITFSYAIAGFMIDLMYVSIGLLAGILYEGGLSSQGWTELYANLTINNGAFSLMFKYILMFSGALWWTIISNPWGFFGTLLGVTPLLSFIILIILLIVLIVLAIKVIWMLIKNFVMILLLIAFGPLQILLGTMGGSGFGGWIKNLAAHLAVYPTVGFMFVLSFIFLRGVGGPLDWLPDGVWPFGVVNVVEGNTWRPPLTTGTNDMDIIWLLGSLVIITLIPKVSDIIKSMIQGRPFMYGAAIGEGLAFATGAGAGVYGYAKGGAMREIGYRSAAWGGGRTGLLGRTAVGLGQSLGGAEIVRDREGQYLGVRRPTETTGQVTGGFPSKKGSSTST